ncbi:MAG: hypothetical protein AB7F96_01595 [Beijerinckiaceae bacterium]
MELRGGFAALMLRSAALAMLAVFCAGPLHAQINLPGAVPPPADNAPAKPAPPAQPEVPAGQGGLRLSASFGGEKPSPIKGGLVWRVFEERAEPDGSYKLVRRSTESTPFLLLPLGNYVVHLSWGLAGATRRIELKDRVERAQITLNAGALRIVGMLGDKKIAADRLSASIYIPDKQNPEAKLIARNVAPGQVLGLPEGSYHIVSTFLDSKRAGTGDDARATNSVVTTDARVRPGQMTDAILKHRAALLTLKLVKTSGGEALANTSFTILTPGGDVLREMIGAFPSITLAEGEYVAIARNEGRTFQGTFKVESGADRDVEIMAK